MSLQISLALAFIILLIEKEIANYMNFQESILYGIKTKKELAQLLDIDEYFLNNIDYYFSTKPFEVNINGKKRILYNPKHKHKVTLKKIIDLLSPIKAEEYVFGGIKNRSYIMNATLHKDSTFFCLIDIKDFFPSTKEKFVYNFFYNNLKMSPDVSKVCTLLTTEYDIDQKYRHLPQGYPSSPYLSYLSYFKLFEELNSIADSKNLIFSCYYDDFTFSSKESISKNTKRSIVKCINKYDLFINESKSKLVKNKNGIKITGVVIRNSDVLPPNKNLYKLFIGFNELKNKFENDPFEKDDILKLCEKVRGLYEAVQKIKLNRDLEYIITYIKDVKIFFKKIDRI